MFLPRRLLIALGAAALMPAAAALLPASASSLSPPVTGYTIKVGPAKSSGFSSDTPASALIDKDGTFYFQQAVAQYGADDDREWEFFTGSNFDTAVKSDEISKAVNPANSDDKNNDTTWRCNNSPTGLEATKAPNNTTYSQRNYCDLVGWWADPDTGDWYGLVHNEFTPDPFKDGLHYDSIDYAVSKDQGKTWTIKDHVLTSPYSTKRADATAFPHETYHYGDGDPRLFVDTASGYFYVYYGSRVIPKGGESGGNGGLAHVARAPMSAKMTPGSWKKWYDGSWSQPGVGGKASNMTAVDSSHPTGYTPVDDDYSPDNSGTVSEQIAAGELPTKSNLFIMNITYNAYLGLYIGDPEDPVQGKVARTYYVTDNLATQKWYRIGDTGAYKNGAWYRWFVDGVNKTDSTIVGKTFRAYCAVECSLSGGDYTEVTIGSDTPAAAPVDLTKTHTISSGSGRVLAQVSGSSATTSLSPGTGSQLESWSFTPNGDGSYQVLNASTGQALGVGATTAATRAWGTKPTATAIPASGPTTGQQWFVVATTSATTGAKTAGYRLVNRYSGLALAMSSVSSRATETTPTRHWSDTANGTIGDGRTSSQQTLTLTSTGSTAPEKVTVNEPDAQTGSVGLPVSLLQISATDSHGKALTYQATGLPAGLSINATTGAVTGTPSSVGASTVQVTATSGSMSASASFTWTIDPDLSGTRTVVTGGQALDDPDLSTAPGTPLITWEASGAANQDWTFNRQSDGSYELVNGTSQLCADVDGGSKQAGASIIQWTCSGTDNQYWYAKKQTNGKYLLESVHSGLLLTTASSSDGALVTQENPSGSALQQWAIS